MLCKLFNVVKFKEEIGSLSVDMRSRLWSLRSRVEFIHYSNILSDKYLLAAVAAVVVGQAWNLSIEKE